MRDRMDDHLIQEPRIRRVVRRQTPRPAGAARPEDAPRTPTAPRRGEDQHD